MTGLPNTEKYLQKLQRFDLATLIARAEVSVTVVDDWPVERVTLMVMAPRPFSDAFGALPDYDMKRVAEALCANEAKPQLPQGCSTPRDFIGEATTTPEIEGGASVLPNLILNRELLIGVATGGPRIEDVNDYYKARHAELKAASDSIGMSYDVPYDDLWAWYHYWREHLPSYADRRHHIRTLFNGLVSAAGTRSTLPVIEREPTGWERVDRTLVKAQHQFAGASNEEDFQAVGLLCREVLISVAQAVYSPDHHQSLDGVKPSSTDAKRMLEAFLHSAFSGDSFKEVRAHARASIDLSLNLQHRRTATRQLAALCLEATSSTTAVIKILSSAE